MKARRAAKPKAPTETEEHKVIASYFRKVGLGEGALAIHIRNEHGSAWERMIGAQMGVLAGMTDWIVLSAGDALCLEQKPRGWKALKARTGNYNDHEKRQLATHDKIRAAGVPVEIFETLEEMLEIMARYGVPLRSESISTSRIRSGITNALAKPE